MLRVTIDICPPEGDKRQLWPLEISNVSGVGLVCDYEAKLLAPGGNGSRFAMVRGHVVSHGAYVLIAKALRALGLDVA